MVWRSAGRAASRPGWIKAPQTDAQRQYIQAEAVYRSFVYQNYLDVDAETESLIRTLFLKEPMSSPGIYEAVTRIRDILEKQVQYAETPPQTPQSADPVRWFLSESRTGMQCSTPLRPSWLFVLWEFQPVTRKATG